MKTKCKLGWIDWLRLLFNSFFRGLKNADALLTSQSGNSANSIGHSIKEARGSLGQDLLDAKETQQVKELRHSLYAVDREARKYKYYSPTLAIKDEALLRQSKTQLYDPQDYEIIAIQDNRFQEKSASEIYNGLMNDGRVGFDEGSIRVERKCTTRYRIEHFIKRVVVLHKPDTSTYYVDLYFSQYPSDADAKFGRIEGKGFVSEMGRLCDNPRPSDIFDIERLQFESFQAFGVEDCIRFSFCNLYWRQIARFDGKFVVRFNAQLENRVDETEQYFCPEMDEKYKNKAPKTAVINPFAESAPKQYECERCGRIIESGQGDSPLEFTDVEIIEQTIGHRLCKNCLEEYLQQHQALSVDNDAQ